jgi:LysM repeat protein
VAAEVPEVKDALLAGSVALGGTEGIERQASEAAFSLEAEAAVVSPGSPLGAVPDRDGLLIYKVQSGDTLSHIAADFDVSLNTLLWANPGIRSGSIRPGQEILVLPVSGVLHLIEEGETLSSVALRYGVSSDDVLRENIKLSGAILPVGEKIVIPGGTRKSYAALTYAGSSLPNLNHYFKPPTTGWNWGQLHARNAVDIANACGTPIYTAQEGLVVKVFQSGWNGGYGKYIDIEHPNGTGTRYAHLNEVQVATGDYVTQGTKVGFMGNTGNVHGATGCHLHYEVRGAQNPLAK